MHGYRRSKKDEQRTESPMPGYEEGTVKKGDPHHAYRHYLDMKRE
jgi:hypothetical protein